MAIGAVCIGGFYRFFSLLGVEPMLIVLQTLGVALVGVNVSRKGNVLLRCEYVLHLQEGRDVMFVGHFLQHTLPSDVPPQLADEVKRMTCLPEPKSDAPPSVTNNFAAGSSAQVMNGPINNSTFNTPKTE